MSGTAQHSAAGASWPGEPVTRRVQVAGWCLFVFVDVMTRVTVYEDLGVAVGVSALIGPLIVALAVVVQAVLVRVPAADRIGAPLLPWIVGPSLLAAALVAAAGGLVRARFGLDLGRWSPLEAGLVALIYYFMVFVVWSVICFWIRAEAARLAERQRAMLAEAQALRTEVQRLRLQLDPHFMLNALNGIGEEIPDHPDAAIAMLRDLSTFLRRSLTALDEPLATVAAETEALASYLRVQQARFGERLVARLEVEDAALSRHIPGFLLQPLLENAIEHGRRAPRAEVALRIALRGPAMEIVVANTGSLAPAPPPRGRTGIGLANIRRRLALHYPGRHAFDLVEAEGRVEARLRLEGAPCSAP